LRVTWNPVKEQANRKKHHMGFAYASEVFRDPFCVVKFDDAHSITEDRYIAIGKADDEVILFVVETELDKDTVEIISARKAEKKERDEYANGNV
jgi:uncharacterized DUF497 family protein